MSNQAKKPGFSARDVAMMVGFGFFVEALALYMLLIDGPLTQRAKAQATLRRTQASYHDLQSVMLTRQAEAQRKAQAASAVRWLHVPPGGTQALVVQRTLDELIAPCGVKLNVFTMGTEPIASSSITAYRTSLSVTGPFESVSRLTRALHEASTSIGIERLAVRPGSSLAQELAADYELKVYVKP